MSIKLVLLAFIFSACGVKRPPIPRNQLPSIVDKYTEINKVNKAKKDEKKKSEKK